MYEHHEIDTISMNRISNQIWILGPNSASDTQTPYQRRREQVRRAQKYACSIKVRS
jgi:hypothetical protein